MRLKIVQAGEPVLRQSARALSAEEIRMPAMRDLLTHMRETMRDAPGVGLAAPQVGLGIQLAVIEDRAEYLAGVNPELHAERERAPVEYFALFNPRIVFYSDDVVDFFEGCLSVAGFSALVRRSRRVTVEYLDEQAEPRRLDASGWYARILQHEIDHLNGHLYIDRMEPRTYSTMENLTRYWKDLSIADVRDRLEIANPGKG